MTRILLLTVMGSLILGGWAWAREQEMLNHSANVHMEEMQLGGCPPTSNPTGGG